VQKASGSVVNQADIEQVKKLLTQTKAIGVILPPPDIRAIVDKTAQFVAKNGKLVCAVAEAYPAAEIGMFELAVLEVLLLLLMAESSMQAGRGCSIYRRRISTCLLS
jgi:hypothetical protein